MEINNNILNERLTHIKITSKETLHVLSVYALPNNSEKKRIFYQHLKEYIQNFVNFNMIITGYFNFVEEAIDPTPNINKRDTYVKRIFKPRNLQLFNVFRKWNKQQVHFTHKTARIDRNYVTESLSLNILKCKHLNLISDHEPVLLELHLEDFKP